MELYSIKLEDGKDYYIIDTIVDGEDRYAVFADEENSNFLVRKVVFHEGEDCFTTLDSKDEYNKVMILFLEKHKREMSEKNE